MVSALSKAHKVAEKLKTAVSEVEFEQWYEHEILKKNFIANDQLTFEDATLRVETDFWSRPSRTRRARDTNNPSDQSSWYETYGRFYKLLPQDKIVNLVDILSTINRYRAGTRHYRSVVTVMKKLAKFSNRDDIIDALNELSTIQTEFKDLQTLTLEDFLVWREKLLLDTSDER